MTGAGPKRELSAFDLLPLAEELRELTGAYFDKITQPSERELVFGLRKPGEGKTSLVFEQGHWLYFRKKEPAESSPHPPPFAMLLRKYLEGTRLENVEQRGFERIIVLESGGCQLVFELFREGNVILVKDGVIVLPLKSAHWEHRDVRGGAEYMFPPERLDPREMGHDEFLELLGSSRSDLVRTLAVVFNLGGRYAEEICFRTGLDRRIRPAQLAPEQKKALHEAIDDIFSQIGNARSPVMVLDGEIPVDFSPIPLKMNQGLPSREYASTNAAVCDYAEYWRDHQMTQARQSVLDDEIGKLERQAENQKKALEGFDKEAVASRSAADAVSARISQVDDMLSAINRLRCSGGWDAVEKAISKGEFRPSSGANAREGTVCAELVDWSGNALAVILDIRKSARQNASALYSTVKQSETKKKRTVLTLEETLRKIETLRTEGPIRIAEEASPSKERKPHWFERYRWFISSDGNVVIAGRDASSNDRIVKRHLKDGDAYAHADIHGAPSVVVKKDKGQIPERTLKEACEFSLSFSRAWAAEVSTGAAYWVNPDQVSKTPQSGEFLPKGAFMIRGRKNVHNDLSPALALGWVDYSSERLLMCGPTSALASRRDDYMTIVPGGEERADAAKKLAQTLGCDTDDVLRLLPPGKSKIGASEGRRGRTD